MPSQLAKTKNGAGSTISSSSGRNSGKRLATKMASIGVVLGCARSAAAFTGAAIRSSSSSVAATARFPRTSAAAAASSAFVEPNRYSHKSLALAGIGGVGINRIGSSLFSTAAAEDTAAPVAAGHDASYDQTNKAAGIIGKYDPEAFESSIYKWWENEGCFQPDAKRSRVKAEAEDKKPYVLPMPPPNVTGRLHMGHAIFVALQDVLARFHRMRGRPVLWLPGAFFWCLALRCICSRYCVNGFVPSSCAFLMRFFFSPTILSCCVAYNLSIAFRN